MKKLLFAALAASTLSTPAFAADWQGKTYGQDAIGVYDLSASVDTFCKFGTSNSAFGLVNMPTADTNYLGGANEADGRFVMDIQKDDDDTVQAAIGGYMIGYAVCNTPFTMKLNSLNGGLKSANTTSDTDFIQLVPYRVGFNFDGHGASSQFLPAGDTVVDTVNEATAASANIGIVVPAQDKLLIEGAYTDTLTASLIPNI
jgi:opacity protein-like surface antigen